MLSALSSSSRGLVPVASLCSWEMIVLYLEASSRTAGREERKVEIFWRAKMSCDVQWVERAKRVAMRLAYVLDLSFLIDWRVDGGLTDTGSILSRARGR